LAAYFSTNFARTISTKAEQEIANALQRPAGESSEMASSGLEEEMPLGMTVVEYGLLLRRLASDLRGNLALTDSGNEVAGVLMRSYHEQAVTQARTQFWFGVGAATVGFLWILLTGLNVSSLAGISKVMPGVIIEAAATLFLKQSSEIRQRATDFYDRLHAYGKQRESLALVASMRDSRLQSAAQFLLALHMAGAPMADAVAILDQKILSRTILVEEEPGIAPPRAPSRVTTVKG
jgi:hypothetical protein